MQLLPFLHTAQLTNTPSLSYADSTIKLDFLIK